MHWSGMVKTKNRPSFKSTKLFSVKPLEKSELRRKKGQFASIEFVAIEINPDRMNLENGTPLHGYLVIPSIEKFNLKWITSMRGRLQILRTEESTMTRF